MGTPPRTLARRRVDAPIPAAGEARPALVVNAPSLAMPLEETATPPVGTVRPSSSHRGCERAASAAGIRATARRTATSVRGEGSRNCPLVGTDAVRKTTFFLLSSSFWCPVAYPIASLTASEYRRVRSRRGGVPGRRRPASRRRCRQARCPPRLGSPQRRRAAGPYARRQATAATRADGPTRSRDDPSIRSTLPGLSPPALPSQRDAFAAPTVTPAAAAIWRRSAPQRRRRRRAATARRPRSCRSRSWAAPPDRRPPAS
jgi:hypothetical protein